MEEVKLTDFFGQAAAWLVSNPQGDSRPLGVAEFFDCRKFASQRHGDELQWPVVDRMWKDITGFTLHQTACDMGERVSRYYNMGAHAGVTRSGKGIWLHSFNRRVAAANGFNRKTISIEVNGRYAGVEGKPSTVWDDPSTKERETGMVLTPESIHTTKCLIRWMTAVVNANGGEIKFILAHRQSSRTRQNDPGEAPWKEIAIPMMAELGLTDGGDGFKIDDGYPIPREWNAERSGFKY